MSTRYEHLDDQTLHKAAERLRSLAETSGDRDLADLLDPQHYFRNTVADLLYGRLGPHLHLHAMALDIAQLALDRVTGIRHGFAQVELDGVIHGDLVILRSDAIQAFGGDPDHYNV
jgi:hypothetical protein